MEYCTGLKWIPKPNEKRAVVSLFFCGMIITNGKVAGSFWPTGEPVAARSREEDGVFVGIDDSISLWQLELSMDPKNLIPDSLYAVLVNAWYFGFPSTPSRKCHRAVRCVRGRCIPCSVLADPLLSCGTTQEFENQLYKNMKLKPLQLNGKIHLYIAAHLRAKLLGAVGWNSSHPVQLAGSVIFGNLKKLKIHDLG